MATPLDQRPRSGPYAGLNARSAKRFLTQVFTEAGLPFAEDDALEIVLAATGLDKTGLVLRGTELLPPDILEVIEAHMARRLSGEPVDHILGWREFYGRLFIVSGDVLSPRADTETLIRDALFRLDENTPQTILDLGTGSGAIGITLLAERPNVRVVATDISDAALSVAKQNASKLGVDDRITFYQGAWWDAVPEGLAFDMILSNPPYISDKAMEGLETEVINFDPDLALRGGVDGLSAYREIISKADEFLVSNGWLGFEIGFDQAWPLAILLMEIEALDTIGGNKDLGGNDRTLWIKKVRNKEA